MAIRAFKIGATALNFWWDIPATTALIRDERETMLGCNRLDENGIMLYRAKAVLGRKSGPLEGREGGREVLGATGKLKSRY